MVAFNQIDEINEKAWQIRRSDMEESLKLANYALDLALDSAYEKGKAISLLNLGILNVYHNFYEKALRQLFTALQYFTKYEMHIHQARALNTIGMVYIIQGDFTKALMQLTKGLEISRTTADIEMIVYLLYNIAEIYKFSYGLYDRALPYLKEASVNCEDNPHVLCGAVLSSLSNCLQHTGETKEALKYAEMALEKAEALQDKISLGLCHEMICSLHKDLKSFDLAWSHCEKSLAYRVELEDEFAQANVWLVMSQICLERDSFEEAIDYANKAVHSAKGAETESILVHLYKVLGEAHYATGEFQKSSEYYKLYIEMNNERVSQELENRISVLTSEMKTKELEKDMEIYRLKNVELKQKHDEIALINQIGQQITASLDLDQIVELIYTRINQLMDAKFLGIGLYRPESEQIEFTHLKEGSLDIPSYSVNMNDKRSFAAKCIKNGEILYIPDVSERAGETVRLGEDLSPDMMKTILYSPLYISERVIGVISIQSEKVNAYDKGDIEIFKSMSNYIAIAINNANQQKRLTETASELRSALEDLNETQDYLIQTEKLAALGGLIAGVAHEINTPLGTSITLGSYIAEEHATLWSHIKENSLTKKALDNYLSHVQEALEGVDKNLRKTAEIVNRFKAVAVDQSTLQIRSFNVYEYVSDILLAFRPKYKHTSHEIELVCDSGLEIESYPGIFAHIINNLLNNSIEHGLSSKEGGQIQIEFETIEGMLHMSFSDNGCGIPHDVLEKVFDPFFSTTKNKGNIGLGLHVVYNMVTQILDGTVQIKSEEGKGVFIDIFTACKLSE